MSRVRIADVVTDNVTGLQWQDDSDAKDKELNWEDAKSYCSAKGDGWRLPTVSELEGIVDYGKYSPVISSTFENVSSYDYWSSSTDKSNDNYAWIVYFYFGDVYNVNKDYSDSVRCVRAGE